MSCASAPSWSCSAAYSRSLAVLPYRRALRGGRNAGQGAQRGISCASSARAAFSSSRIGVPLIGRLADLTLGLQGSALFGCRPRLPRVVLRRLSDLGAVHPLAPEAILDQVPP